MMKSYSNLSFGGNMTRKLFISIALIASSVTNCYAALQVSPGDTTPDGKWTYMCVTNRTMDGSKEALESCSTDPDAKGDNGNMHP